MIVLLMLYGCGDHVTDRAHRAKVGEEVEGAGGAVDPEGQEVLEAELRGGLGRERASGESQRGKERVRLASGQSPWRERRAPCQHEVHYSNSMPCVGSDGPPLVQSSKLR